MRFRPGGPPTPRPSPVMTQKARLKKYDLYLFLKSNADEDEPLDVKVTPFILLYEITFESNLFVLFLFSLFVLI